MAVKFSQFVVETDKANVNYLVGWDGVENVQITPADLLSGTPSGSGAAGQVAFFDSASTLAGDNDLYWDNTNKRLGISTSSPQEKLDISSGSIRLDDNQKITWSTNDSNIGRVRITGNESNDFITFVTDNSERMRIAGNNVGIGTTSPSAKLDVDGSLIATGISQLGSGGSNVYLTSSSAGNVGIGTSSPNNKLVVNGTVHLGSNGSDVTIGASNSSVIFMLRSGYNYIQASDASGALMFRTGGNNNRMIIDSSGNVGIGTASPTTKLHIDESGTTSPALFIDTARYGASIIGDGTSNSLMEVLLKL
jgi:hypothetical protein